MGKQRIHSSFLVIENNDSLNVLKCSLYRHIIRNKVQLCNSLICKKLTQQWRGNNESSVFVLLCLFTTRNLLPDTSDLRKSNSTQACFETKESFLKCIYNCSLAIETNDSAFKNFLGFCFLNLDIGPVACASHLPPRRGGELPYMGYIGMCGPKGRFFFQQPFWS